MAGILHGGTCHSFHHNHSHGNDLLSHRQRRSSGDDEMKALQIDDSDFMTTQSECKSENINVQAAFLHVLGDFIQSIGVIIAAVVIKVYVCNRDIYTFLFVFITFFAARSENRRSINHVFLFNHRDLHDR